MQNNNINGTTRVRYVELGMLMDPVMRTAKWIVLSGMTRYTEMTQSRYGEVYVRGDVLFRGLGSARRHLANGLSNLGKMKHKSCTSSTRIFSMFAAS
jgi:hypothetical protein